MAAEAASIFANLHGQLLQNIGKHLDNVIEPREQAVRDKVAEVPNNERVERLFNELAEAPGIIERSSRKKGGADK